MDNILELVRENPIGIILLEVVLIAFIIGRAICWIIGRIKKEKLGKLTLDKAMLYIGYGIIPTIILTNQMFKDEDIRIEGPKRPNSQIEEEIEEYVEQERQKEYDPEYWKAYYDIRNKEVLEE